MIGEPEKLKLSDTKEVEVGVLDGFEQDLADGILADLIGSKYAPGDFPTTKLILLQNKVYAACSLRKVNSEVVAPMHNLLEYTRAVRTLTKQERDELEKWAAPHYNPTVAEVKKDDSVKGEE